MLDPVLTGLGNTIGADQISRRTRHGVGSVLRRRRRAGADAWALASGRAVRPDADGADNEHLGHRPVLLPAVPEPQRGSRRRRRADDARTTLTGGGIRLPDPEEANHSGSTGKISQEVN